MRILLFIFLTGTGTTWGQLTFSGSSNSLGRGTSVSTSIDFFALNTNPSNLGWQSRFYDHKLSFKVFDLSVMTSTPVTIRGSLRAGLEGHTPMATVPDVFWSYWEGPRHDTTFTLEDRLETRDLLTRRSSLKYSRSILGASYTTENYGTFAVQVNTEITGTIQLSERTANLFMLGKINPYFDSLVLSSGEVIANNPSNYSNDTLYQIVHAFSNDTLTVGQQLEGSYFKGMHTRNYSFGWGNTYTTLIPGWETTIGATINFIEGLEYYRWETRNEEFYLQNANGGNQNLSGIYRHPGYGTSVSLGMSLIRNDKFIVGASLNNLGFIRWKGRRGVVVAEYNSVNDKTPFDYPFGTSKYTSYYDQWNQANLYLSSGKNYEEGGSFTTATAANLSLGAQWRASRFVALSSDIVLPVNPNAVGSYRYAYLAFGTELTLKGIGISAGINNNFNRLNVPCGITFGSIRSRAAFTLATGDLLSYLRGRGVNNLSLSAGLTLRFR
jgi:hypothetical protein